MKKLGQISVLGTKYDVLLKAYNEDEIFKTLPCVGHCNFIRKEIVACNLGTAPGYEKETAEDVATYVQVTLRHEIIHAFLYESGLDSSSSSVEDAWARNEEMIDWIALQLPKIIKECEKVAALG